MLIAPGKVGRGVTSLLEVLARGRLITIVGVKVVIALTGVCEISVHGGDDDTDKVD